MRIGKVDGQFTVRKQKAWLLVKSKVHIGEVIDKHEAKFNNIESTHGKCDDTCMRPR